MVNSASAVQGMILFDASGQLPMSVNPTDKVLLTPENCTVIFVDYQPQMFLGVASIDRQVLLNNLLVLAKAAKIFGVPVVLTAVESKEFKGDLFPELLELFPGETPNMELRWEGVPSLSLALQMLREQAARTPAPQWVRVVGGWTEFQFAERRMPTLEEINAAAPDTPVFILHLYCRALLNRAALKACGYTKDTPNPAGGAGEMLVFSAADFEDFLEPRPDLPR